MKYRVLGLIIGLAAAAPLAHPATAGADGLPVPVTVSPDGATAPGATDRYVTLPAQQRSTVVARVDQEGGEVAESRSLDGRLTVPAVGYDGSPSGLSADGETLVLIRPRATFPQTRTRFVVLGAERLNRREAVTLRGDFSFDAISPDGSRIYLIEYLSRADPTKYEVREYDVRSGRLLPEPIVDPDEPPGEMRGYPMTRAVSPDGRWAYTLYDGGGDHPFVHALDTVEGRAVCIDIHALADYPSFRGALGNNVSRFGLTVSPDGGEFSVVDRDKGPLALVDAETFAVSDPTASDDGDGSPWVLVGLAAVAFVAAVLTLGLRRRRHGVAPGGAA
jgi:DNA-binding beta-propeller fold protein YncE